MEYLALGKVLYNLSDSGQSAVSILFCEVKIKLQHNVNHNGNYIIVKRNNGNFN